jgi:hypothetical protein
MYELFNSKGWGLLGTVPGSVLDVLDVLESIDNFRKDIGGVTTQALNDAGRWRSLYKFETQVHTARAAGLADQASGVGAKVSTMRKVMSWVEDLGVVTEVRSPDSASS